MLEIKNFTKKYGNFVAVDNLSLTVNDGEIYGFIGHNGAGKSTTIKAVVGALAFNEGDILIGGRSIKTYPYECKRETAYIPDNPDIYENLTGIQFLNFILDVFNVSDNDRNERINKYADMFGIKNNLGDIISSYSHGMKQKLVLISALCHEPKLLILDEPFVGLDPVAAFKLKETMRELCDKGCSIFFSTHVLEVAEKLCDRIGIIKEGKLITEGTVSDVVGNASLEKVFLELQGGIETEGEKSEQ